MNKRPATSIPPGAELSPYDTAEFLHTPEDIADYLEAVFETYDGDYRLLIKALGTVARARGMQRVANETGLQRQGLYKSLSEGGNPSFETVLKVMDAVGVELKPALKQTMPMTSRVGSLKKGRSSGATKHLKRDALRGKTASTHRKAPVRKQA
jgi:probable addiction module antidote protein